MRLSKLHSLLACKGIRIEKAPIIHSVGNIFQIGAKPNHDEYVLLKQKKFKPLVLAVKYPGYTGSNEECIDPLDTDDLHRLLYCINFF